MSDVSMPQDDNNFPIPALRLKDGGAHAIAVGAASARNAAAFAPETRVVSLYATGPVFLRFGGATVNAAATDHYFPAGIYYDVAIASGKTQLFTHIAAIRAEFDGILYVSEKL